MEVDGTKVFVTWAWVDNDISVKARKQCKHRILYQKVLYCKLCKSSIVSSVRKGYMLYQCTKYRKVMNRYMLGYKFIQAIVYCRFFLLYRHSGGLEIYVTFFIEGYHWVIWVNFQFDGAKRFAKLLSFLLLSLEAVWRDFQVDASALELFKFWAVGLSTFSF